MFGRIVVELDQSLRQKIGFAVVVVVGRGIEQDYLLGAMKKIGFAEVVGMGMNIDMDIVIQEEQPLDFAADLWMDKTVVTDIDMDFGTDIVVQEYQLLGIVAVVVDMDMSQDFGIGLDMQHSLMKQVDFVLLLADCYCLCTPEAVEYKRLLHQQKQMQDLLSHVVLMNYYCCYLLAQLVHIG